MKRNKDKRIFAKILIRYIICTVVFSIPLWVFGDRYLLLIEDVTGSESFYDIGTVIVTNLVLVLVITLIFMLRAARLLDREYDALDGIVDDDYVSPKLPNIISGDFTKKGHFIVMTGIENGKIKINDPNSIENSNKLWNFDDISSQINNLWAMRV